MEDVHEKEGRGIYGKKRTGSGQEACAFSRGCENYQGAARDGGNGYGAGEGVRNFQTGVVGLSEPEQRERVEDLELSDYDPFAIVEKTGGRMAEDIQWIKIRYYKA